LDFSDRINSKNAVIATNIFSKAGKHTVSLTVRNTTGISTVIKINIVK